MIRSRELHERRLLYGYGNVSGPACFFFSSMKACSSLPGYPCQMLRPFHLQWQPSVISSAPGRAPSGRGRQMPARKPLPFLPLGYNQAANGQSRGAGYAGWGMLDDGVR